MTKVEARLLRREAHGDRLAGVVQQAAQLADHGVERSELAKHAFAEIGDAIAGISEHVAGMADTSGAIATVAEQSSAAAQQMTSATQETSAHSQEVSVSLGELSRTADRVFHAATRFSLDDPAVSDR